MDQDPLDVFAPSSSPLPMIDPYRDDNLLIGASYGSDVTVSEVVVYASSGGGGDVIAYDDAYEYFYNESPENNMSGWDAFIASVTAEAQSFATSHVSGDVNSPVYTQAVDALAALYAKIKVNLYDTSSFFPGPNGATMTFSEMMASLQQTQIVIGPHNGPSGGWTDVNPAMNVIYIDPAQLSQYTNQFGVEKGTNYVIYHELAHASIDGESEARNSAYASVLEASANERGQIFANMMGASYPSDAELVTVGGSMPRYY